MKKFLCIFTIFISTFFLTGCAHDKGVILFNTQPITQANALNGIKNFKVGTPIYYLFIAPKEMNNEFIRIQVFKMTDLASFGGYEVVRTKDYRLMLDERYYHCDYFVLHEKGRYVMQVFSHDDFVRPLAYNNFFVE